MGGIVINLYDFETCEGSNMSYGGHSGSKKGILINGEKWFLKYPKSTKSMQVEGISYTTAPFIRILLLKFIRQLKWKPMKRCLAFIMEK